MKYFEALDASLQVDDHHTKHCSDSGHEQEHHKEYRIDFVIDEHDPPPRKNYKCQLFTFMDINPSEVD